MTSQYRNDVLRFIKIQDVLNEFNTISKKFNLKDTKKVKVKEIYFEDLNILNLDFLDHFFEKLEKITIKKCNLTNSILSGKLKKIHVCKYLDLSGNKLTKIPNLNSFNLENLNLSYNNIEYIDGTFIENIKILTYIDLSNNRIDFPNELELQKFILSLKNLKFLKRLDIEKNKFFEIYQDAYWRFILELIDNLKIFNGQEINVEKIKKNKDEYLKKLKPLNSDENKERNKEYSDDYDEIPFDFSIFIKYIEDCIQKPSDQRDWLQKLKDKSLYIIDKNQEITNVFFSYGDLKEQMIKFLEQITILIENQDITQINLFEILAKLTQINQENFGNLCYDNLEYLSKKNRVFKKNISDALKDNCLYRFKKLNIKDLAENQFSKFTKILLKNELYNIIDKDMYKYLNRWFETILEDNLNFELGEAILINIFKFSYLTVISTEIEVDFIKIILNIFFVYRENKAIFTENNRNFKLIFLKYISKLITLFCDKDSNCEHYNFLEDMNFYNIFLDELNENLREIETISKGNNYENNSYITQLCNSFSCILNAFNKILKNSKEIIEVTDFIYLKNEETKKIIFQEIGTLHLNKNLPLKMISSILEFINSCLLNTKLVKDGEYISFVKLISETINSSIDLLKSLEKMDNNLNDDEIDYVINVCKIIYFYCYNSNLKNCELGDFCLGISNQLDKLDRESILFDFLTIYNDDLKLAIVEILNSIRFDEYEYGEVTKIYSIVQKCKNVGTGKNELILGTLLLILAKIIKITEHRDNFIQENGKDSIFDFLELLHKNIKRDVRDDIEEQLEKDILSCSFIFFFKILKEFYILKDKNDIKKANNYINKILKEEYKLSVRISAPIEIEKTIIEDKIEYLVSYIKKKKIPGKSIQFFRIINHLANILEKHKYENPDLEEKHFIIEDVIEYFKNNLDNSITLELSNFKKSKNKIFNKKELEEIHDNFISFDGLNKILIKISDSLKENEKESIKNIKSSNLIEFNKYYEVFKEELKNKIEDNDNNFLNLFSKIINKNNKIIKINQKSKDLIENELKTLDINKIQNEGEAFRYIININIPEFVLKQKKIKIEKKENFINPDDNDLIYEKKILTINLNCILRIIYNLLIYQSNYDNLKIIIKKLLKFDLISDITKLCELVGWNSFYISTKFIIIITKILELRFKYFNNENFDDILPYYDLTFTNLSKIIKFIQKDFSKDKIAFILKKTNLDILKIITNCNYKIIKIWLRNLESLNNEYISKNFELHTNNENPQIPYSQFVIDFYFPIEFIMVFIEIKIYLIMHLYKKEMDQKIKKLIFSIVINIKKILGNYIYIFPCKKFQIIKQFLNYSENSELSIHTSVIYDILNFSAINGKKHNLKILFENRNYFIHDFENENENDNDNNNETENFNQIKLCFQAVRVNKSGVKKLFYFVMNNYFIYLATCSEENKCSICNNNSLCPIEPEIDSSFNIKTINMIYILPDKKSIFIKFNDSKNIYLEFLSEDCINELKSYSNILNIKIKNLKYYNGENNYTYVFPTGFILNKNISQEISILNYYLKNKRYIFLINKIQDLIEIHSYIVDYENLEKIIDCIDDISDDGTYCYISQNIIFNVNDLDEINIIDSVHSNIVFKRGNITNYLIFTNSESGELFKININPYKYSKAVKYSI